MNNQQISLVTSVLDELATVGCLTCNKYKTQSLELIKDILKDFKKSQHSSKANTTIQAMQDLANVNCSDINKQLLGIVNLCEKALTELYK